MRILRNYIHKITHQIILVALMIFLLQQCSTTKNNALNRFYHSTTVKYNILFNGKVAYKRAMDSLQKHLRIDYNKKMPFVLTAQEKLDTTSFFYRNLDFAEEKAVKSIQKHGMLIKGVERNNQIDESYLLLGKSRYYTRRLAPALEAFSEVITKNYTGNRIPEALLWKATTQFDLGNYIETSTTLKKLIRGKYTKSSLASAYELLSHLYWVTDKKADAINVLKKAIILSQKETNKVKRQLLLGQYYQEKKENESAKKIFKSLYIKKRTPYPFNIIALLCHLNIGLENTKNTLSILKKYRNRRKYQPYLGDIYLALGDLYTLERQEALAIKNYRKASNVSNIPKQKGYIMKKLANHFLQKGNYELTNKYYDSILALDISGNYKIKFQKKTTQ